MAGTGRTASVRATEPRLDDTSDTATRRSDTRPLSSPSKGSPVNLFPHPYRRRRATEHGSGGRCHPDGRFLINTELDSAAAPMTLLQNWHRQGKK